MLGFLWPDRPILPPVLLMLSSAASFGSNFGDLVNTLLEMSCSQRLGSRLPAFAEPLAGSQSLADFLEAPPPEEVDLLLKAGKGAVRSAVENPPTLAGGGPLPVFHTTWRQLAAVGDSDDLLNTGEVVLLHVYDLNNRFRRANKVTSRGRVAVGGAFHAGVEYQIGSAGFLGCSTQASARAARHWRQDMLPTELFAGRPSSCPGPWLTAPGALPSVRDLPLQPARGMSHSRLRKLRSASYVLWELRYFLRSLRSGAPLVGPRSRPAPRQASVPEAEVDRLLVYGGASGWEPSGSGDGVEQAMMLLQAADAVEDRDALMRNVWADVEYAQGEVGNAELVSRLEMQLAGQLVRTAEGRLKARRDLGAKDGLFGSNPAPPEPRPPARPAKAPPPGAPPPGQDGFFQVVLRESDEVAGLARELPAEELTATLATPRNLGAALDLVGAYLKNYEIDKADLVLERVVPLCREKGGTWLVKALDKLCAVRMKQFRAQETLVALKEIEQLCPFAPEEGWEFHDILYRNFAWCYSALDEDESGHLTPARMDRAAAAIAHTPTAPPPGKQYRATVDAICDWVEKTITRARGRSALFFGFDLNDGFGLRQRGPQIFEQVDPAALGPYGRQLQHYAADRKPEPLGRFTLGVVTSDFDVGPTFHGVRSATFIDHIAVFAWQDHVPFLLQVIRTLQMHFAGRPPVRSESNDFGRGDFACWPLVETFERASRQLRAHRRVRLSSEVQLLVGGMRNAWKKRQFAEVWRLSHQLAAQCKGPRRRRYSAGDSFLPRRAEIARHFARAGADGGLDAIPIEFETYRQHPGVDTLADAGDDARGVLVAKMRGMTNLTLALALALAGGQSGSANLFYLQLLAQTSTPRSGRATCSAPRGAHFWKLLRRRALGSTRSTPIARARWPRPGTRVSSRGTCAASCGAAELRHSRYEPCGYAHNPSKSSALPCPLGRGSQREARRLFSGAEALAGVAQHDNVALGFQTFIVGSAQTAALSGLNAPVLSASQCQQLGKVLSSIGRRLLASAARQKIPLLGGDDWPKFDDNCKPPVKCKAMTDEAGLMRLGVAPAPTELRVRRLRQYQRWLRSPSQHPQELAMARGELPLERTPTLGADGPVAADANPCGLSLVADVEALLEVAEASELRIARRRVTPSGAIQWRRCATLLPGPAQTITRAILRSAAGGRGFPWPHATRPNGDLRGRFDAALRARPGRAAAVKKVKGHVDSSEVQSSFEEHCRAGHDFADQSAHRGRRYHGPRRGDARAAVESRAAAVRRAHTSPLGAQGRMLDQQSEVSCVEPAVPFELETRARLPVLVDRKWHLPDLAPSVNVVHQTLKQNSVLLQASLRTALALFERVANALLRAEGRDALPRHAPSHAMSCLAVDVLNHAPAGNSLSAILDLGTNPPTDALILAELRVVSGREAAGRHSAANKAAARRDGRGLVFSDPRWPRAALEFPLPQWPPAASRLRPGRGGSCSM
ncbi:unnamed protein product [Prorocentrum cordatum]|uniref:Uncharacterized protein n=1 Tax=Prorocentrum cordatum TaxID=2364126 RepID=A0ABN9XUU0_9DINO|nr:unnamed protein product [Polarella glacialis]